MISLVPPGFEMTSFSNLGELPHFNPDLDTELGPAPVLYLRAELSRSQAVVISAPEYDHGVPGALKNGLDWVVRSGELYEKPVALINFSARSIYAQASLAEILRTMGAHIVTEACVILQTSGPLSPAESSQRHTSRNLSARQSTRSYAPSNRKRLRCGNYFFWSS